jgi:hypothetical protein
MLSLSSHSISPHSIIKTPTSKKPLNYHKEILYALSTKKKGKVEKDLFKDSGLLDILPLKRGLKEYLKIREGGEKEKIKSKKRQKEECCLK